jgi:uncharacterized protein (DUF697 family)
VSTKEKLKPWSLLSVLREVRAGGDERRPLVVDGARELVPLLAGELRAGGDAAAVREGGSVDGAAALVWIGNSDDERLRAASLAQVPIVGVTDGSSLPYVLDTNLVFVRPGESMPVGEVARALARVLGTRGAALGLAQRLPVLREATIDELIRSAARRNAAIAAAVWAPGVDMPVLTLNQIRLVLRIALAYGKEVDGSRVPDVLGVVGAGFGFRAVARQLVGLVPLAGWATRGAVAYAGTVSVGEAARRRFELM